MSLRTITALAVVALINPTHAAPSSRVIAVENGAGLEFVHVVPQAVTYKGQKALRLVEASGDFNGDPVALVNDLDFKDGTIEIDLAGLPGAGSSDTARGFVGVAFRSAPHASTLECFYLRPTNGRADDQLRRNHSAQYVSHPAFPWQKLRSETPGLYESYVDLESGAWTHVRIEVSGVHARLFVNGAAQPALIVNDLKRGVTSGAIGLWIGPGTEAYFRNLHVTTN
jgi:3-keto-disaccharide hydrolase